MTKRPAIIAVVWALALSIGVAGGLLPTGAAFAGTVHPTRCADNGSDKQMSREAILARARSWVADLVPYSKTHCYQDAHGDYRTDCSGFVSMAWGLGGRGDIWWTGNLDQRSVPIAAGQLLPGDALLRSEGNPDVDHVALFVRWADAAQTRPVVIEETGGIGRAVERTWSGGYNGYTPVRYNFVVSGQAHAVSVSGGKVFHTVRYVDGSWTPWVSLNNPGTATSVTAAADAAGNTQLTAVIDGIIHHRIRYSDGTWTGWGTLDPATPTTTSVSASVDRTANVMHLAAVIGGVIHHRIRWTNGTWSPWTTPATPGTPGSVSQVSISVDHTHNILQMTAVIAGTLHHRVRNTEGTWTPFYPIEATTTVTAAATSTDHHGHTHVAELVNNPTGGTGGTVNHRIRYTDGTWSAWAPIATGATAITAAVDTTHNNLQTMTIIGGTAHHRIRNTDGTWTNWHPYTPTNTTTTIAITLV